MKSVFNAANNIFSNILNLMIPILIAIAIPNNDGHSISPRIDAQISNDSSVFARDDNFYFSDRHLGFAFAFRS